MAESTQHEWLNIFLVYNNNYYDLDRQDTKDYYTMEEQTQYILSQIRRTKFSEKVKTIFIEVEIKNTEAEITATLSILEKKGGSWLPAFDKVWRKGEAKEILTDSASLQKILTMVTSKYTANKYMIITAGHGSIVGVNYYIPKLIPKSSKANNKEFKTTLKEGENYNKDAQDKLDRPLDVEEAKRLLFLSNKAISDAFRVVFGTKKVDVLVMYNCLMQNIFTQYEFRETVDWFVAPLSGISIPGFNYGSILNEISVNPDIDGEMVAQLFINSIRAGNGYSLFKKDIECSWKIVAIKMNSDNYNSIQQKFEDLFLEINTLAKTNRLIISCINQTVRFLFNYSFYCLKEINVPDLGILLAFLKETINVQYNMFIDLLPKIEALQSALNLPNKEFIFEGTDFYKSKESFKEDDPNFKSTVKNIGILFPFLEFESDLLQPIYNKDNYVNINSENKTNIPSFLKSSNYAEVITALLNLPQ